MPTIETRFDVGDEVWFVSNNAIIKGKISSLGVSKTINGECSERYNVFSSARGNDTLESSRLMTRDEAIQYHQEQSLKVMRELLGVEIGDAPAQNT